MFRDRYLKTGLSSLVKQKAWVVSALNISILEVEKQTININFAMLVY